MNKIYLYPDAEPQTYYKGYPDCVPFSPEGMARYCSDVKNPEEADLIYCGQYHDTAVSRLAPENFVHLGRWPGRHVFDVEGDWKDREMPDFLRDSIVIALNAFDKHRDWRVVVRPGCSKLLVHMARKGADDFTAPRHKRFQFLGQRDSLGVRQKMCDALLLSGLPHDFRFNGFWGAGLEPSDLLAEDYRSRILESPFILCPRGEGHATMRVYEACALGRIPVIIADHLLVGWDTLDTSFVFRISPDGSTKDMARSLAQIYETGWLEIGDRCRAARRYFDDVIRPYFKDPTAYFLNHARAKGWI